MQKEQIQTYRRRWKLVAKAEEQEIREASLDFLLKQTFSIWEIARTLNFLEQKQVPDMLWTYLQKKWLCHRA
jgi:hypothetical protein